MVVGNADNRHMERSHTAKTVADTVLVLVLFGLALFAAVMPAVVIAVGAPATVLHRLLVADR